MRLEAKAGVDEGEYIMSLVENAFGASLTPAAPNRTAAGHACVFQAMEAYSDWISVLSGDPNFDVHIVRLNQV